MLARIHRAMPQTIDRRECTGAAQAQPPRDCLSVCQYPPLSVSAAQGLYQSGISAPVSVVCCVWRVLSCSAIRLHVFPDKTGGLWCFEASLGAQQE